MLGHRINAAARGVSIHLFFPAAFHPTAYASFEPAQSLSVNVDYFLNGSFYLASWAVT